MLFRKWKRRYLYRLAVDRARETGKPLLVIGDPYNGVASIITGPDYSCGDLTIDITGSPGCPKTFKGKLEMWLRDNDITQYVVFISCVLEYVDDIQYIATKLNQIPTSNLFIVNVEPNSLMAYLYPHFLTGEGPPKRVIYACPPWNAKIRYFSL